MPSVETSIFQAVKARVDTLPMKAAYPIVWSTNKAHSPSPTQPYIRATWIPNVNRRLFLRGSDPHQRLAILQIDVMGIKSHGDDVAIEVAGQIAAHFAADTPMFFQGVKVRVQRAPDISQVIAGDTHLQVPLTVAVESFS
jgi:hypothetical protein